MKIQPGERLLNIPPRTLLGITHTRQLVQVTIQATIAAHSTPTITYRLIPDFAMLTNRDTLTRHLPTPSSSQPASTSIPYARE